MKYEYVRYDMLRPGDMFTYYPPEGAEVHRDYQRRTYFVISTSPKFCTFDVLRGPRLWTPYSSRKVYRWLT